VVTPTRSPRPTATGTTTAQPRELAWKAIDAKGPSARRDHTFTANDTGTIAFVFGGRANGKPLSDLWALDRSSNAWAKVGNAGPAARFGHSATFIDGHLVVFGGQGAGATFFNDSWAFDPVKGRWTKLGPPGKAPAARYGAGGTRIGSALTITHGFTSTGRFDDTWALASKWTDVSPNAGRPLKRCLHRATWLPGLGRMLLFGGQTDGTPYLGDTWLYDPSGPTWTEVKHGGPSARNLYALGATDKFAYLFGGATAAGPSAEVWSFGSAGWKKLKPSGKAPSGRSGVEGAIVSGPSMLVFGGTDGRTELSDLWELTLPS
jgi:N-acetylneuraminic acid mutarotase